MQRIKTKLLYLAHFGKKKKKKRGKNSWPKAHFANKYRLLSSLATTNTKRKL